MTDWHDIKFTSGTGSGRDASDGDEVVQKVKQLQPEIILTDIRMPRMNGVEGTRLVREKFLI